jgi:hypothetical protein
MSTKILESSLATLSSRYGSTLLPLSKSRSTGNSRSSPMILEMASGKVCAHPRQDATNQPWCHAAS